MFFRIRRERRLRTFTKTPAHREVPGKKKKSERIEKGGNPLHRLRGGANGDQIREWKKKHGLRKRGRKLIPPNYFKRSKKGEKKLGEKKVRRKKGKRTKLFLRPKASDQGARENLVSGEGRKNGRLWTG